MKHIFTPFTHCRLALSQPFHTLMLNLQHLGNSIFLLQVLFGVFNPHTQICWSFDNKSYGSLNKPESVHVSDGNFHSGQHLFAPRFLREVGVWGEVVSLHSSGITLILLA